MGINQVNLKDFWCHEISSQIPWAMVPSLLLASHYFLLSSIYVSCTILLSDRSFAFTLLFIPESSATRPDPLLHSYYIQNVSSCCCCLVTQLCPTHCDPMDCSTPGFPVHHELLELTQTHVMPCNRLILCRPLLLLPSIFPSIRVFSSESVLCIRWPKYQDFSFSICPSNKYSGLISFGIDCFHLLAIQGTPKSLLQHHSSKASILWHSAFFTVQFSHPYMTTGKIIALTRWTFVGKVMSRLFNTLSRLVITFLQRSKRLLISWSQSPSAVILESKKMKPAPACTFPPSICH